MLNYVALFMIFFLACAVAAVFDTLEHTDGLAEMYKVPGFHTQLEGKNGGGDRWYTDGALSVGVIKESFEATG